MITMHEVAREDGQLVEEALGGSQLSFQLLIERYQDRIFALARHYTKNAVEIEDIVQDTFLKVYRRLETFQRQSSFSTWLYRIAVNTALDFLKRTGRSPVAIVEDPEICAAPVRAQRPGRPVPAAVRLLPRQRRAPARRWLRRRQRAQRSRHRQPGLRTFSLRPLTALHGGSGPGRVPLAVRGAVIWANNTHVGDSAAGAD